MHFGHLGHSVTTSAILTPVLTASSRRTYSQVCGAGPNPPHPSQESPQTAAGAPYTSWQQYEKFLTGVCFLRHGRCVTLCVTANVTALGLSPLYVSRQLDVTLGMTQTQPRRGYYINV
jgi:hypothetical protein